jgi:hypothetical protein
MGTRSRIGKMQIVAAIEAGARPSRRCAARGQGGSGVGIGGCRCALARVGDARFANSFRGACACEAAVGGKDPAAAVAMKTRRAFQGSAREGRRAATAGLPQRWPAES